MSQLAAKVGITKPAIYRHFKNKDAVAAEMKNHFFDLLATNIVEIQKLETDGKCASNTQQFLDLISFFAENPQYINYFIRQFSHEEDFEQVMREELSKRGAKDEFEEFYKDIDYDKEKKIKRYAHGFFCGLSILFFIKARERVFEKTGYKSPVEEFAPKLIKFVYSGFKGSVKEDSQLYPVKVSEERMKELDELCSVIPSDLPTEDKIFTAFADVIKKYGINGVTVEHIAKELNMAKSSLYFYFENKNQMIYSLVSKEINLLKTICAENISEAKTYSEFIYINMRTEISYFLARPSILLICGWLLQSGTEPPFDKEEDCDEANNQWEARLKDAVAEIDIGIKLLPKYITFWTGLLPVVLVVLREKHDFDENETVEALRYMFNFVLYGAEA